MSAVDLSRLRRPDECSSLTDQNGNSSNPSVMDDIYDEDVSELDVAKKDWSQMNWKLSQAGFREGVDGGEEQALQSSFNTGYSMAAKEACELGRIQGQISALLLFNRHIKHGQLFSEEMSNHFKQLLAEINSYKLTNSPPGISLTCGAKERINEAVFQPEKNSELSGSVQYHHLNRQSNHTAAYAYQPNHNQNQPPYLDTNEMYDLDSGVTVSTKQNITTFKDRFQRLLQMCDGSLVAKFIS
ncbi:protein YAE1 homolog [Argonauta hians]